MISKIKSIYKNQKINLQTTKSLFIVIIAIITFNTLANLISKTPIFPRFEKRSDASGLSNDKAEKFVYFYYYKHLFPLASLSDSIQYSSTGADNEIMEHPNNLIMEYKHWSRLGENARIFTYMPHATLKGTAKNPSNKLFNILFFTLSLIILYIGFFAANKARLGLILVILINLSPFFLYEIFANNNIFGLLGALFILILGLNAKWLFSKKLKLYILISAIVSGILIGFISEIRNETIIVLTSGVLIYLLNIKKSTILSILSIILIVFSTIIVKKQINNYFNKNFEKTYELVKKVSGHTYDGKRIRGHKSWHPIFCGLGDFDYKYGYKWDDKVAYRYAVPILRKKGFNIKYSDKLYLDQYYDKDSLYYVKFDEIPEYDDIVKQKVLSDISKTPFWYLYILLMRTLTILTITQPIPLLGWLAFLISYYLYKTKQWQYLKLIIISLPLSTTSLIIFALKGTTYNSMFPLISLGIMIYLGIKFKDLFKFRKKLQKQKE